MYVIVVGMGEVGTFLVNVLDKEGHDVVAIDNSSNMLADVEDEQDVATLKGHGGSPEVLQLAKAHQADLLVTCTDDDEINLVGALFGKQLGAKRAVARIQGTEYTGEDLGVHQDLPEGGLDTVREVLFAALRSGAPRGRGHVFPRGLVELRLEVAELLGLVLCKFSSIPVRNVAHTR